MGGSKASAAVVAWLRDESGPRTQEFLAERLGIRLGRSVNQATISAICAGKSTPKVDMLLAIRDELGIPIEWWVIPADVPSGVVMRASSRGKRAVAK